MKKLSIADLEKRSESVASQELLNSIAGGNTKQSECHSDSCHGGDSGYWDPFPM